MLDELPAHIQLAFDVSGPTRPLPGGAGTCWQVGEVVLKPGHHPRVGAWLAELFDGVRDPGFQVPQPIRTTTGAWVVDGWAAWTRVDGEPMPLARWPELVAASRAFHAALADRPAPRWVGRGRNQWAVADRVAWGIETVEPAPELAGLISALQAEIRPLALPDQLVHGDIAGNLLFAPGQPPTVIDFSPYWRPAGYPLAVAAVDLLTWSDAPPSILDELAGEPELDQLLLRASIFRLVTESIGRPDPETRQAVRRANEPVVELLLARLVGRPPTTAYRTDQDLAGLIEKALGQPVTRLDRVAYGHSRAVCAIVDCADGSSVFVKTDADLDNEIAVYESVGSKPFLPELLAVQREPVPMLILEALPQAGWLGHWTPELVEATRNLLDQVHATPAPAGLPQLASSSTTTNPWQTIAADPQRLLRMRVCSADWLAAHLDTLSSATAAARLDGHQLIHRDLHAANLCQRNGKLVLVDWASAAIGNPWFAHHLWLVALNAEGGPIPEVHSGPGAAGHAALIAGQQPLLTPARDANPLLFEQRRRRLGVALSWAARQLHIPPPESLANSTFW